MSFGPQFEIPHQIDGQPVTVVMRHAKDGDASKLAELLTDFGVQQFVNLSGGPTAKDEEEFLEDARTRKDGWLWVVAVRYEDGREELVGTTGLSRQPSNWLTSGILLSNRRLWRKGIAGVTHRLRTWYGFCELGAYAIESAYIEENVGSGAALRGIGYVEYGRLSRRHLTAGRWREMILLVAYNPHTVPVLWPDGDVPADVQAGLKKTEAALEYAANIIKPR